MNQFNQTIKIKGEEFHFHKTVNTKLLNIAEQKINNPKEIFQTLKSNINGDVEKQFIRKVINGIIKAKSLKLNTVKLNSRIKIRDAYTFNK